MSSEKINLDGVKETLLLPLWGRAYETQKLNPMLIDTTAVQIIGSINYDFSKIEQKVNPLSRASWIARSIYFDSKIRNFQDSHPNGTIINIGCGLDTTYERVNNNKAVWYELDFPDVINLRRKYISETDNRLFLPFSVFDKAWYGNIKNKENVFIMIAGVIYYFEEENIKLLFEKIGNEFEKCEIVFDYSSPKGVKIANRKVIDDGGMEKSAYLKWGIKNIYEIERWNTKIKILENMKMYHDHRKRYPIQKRLGMFISDALSVMSLALLRIE